MKSFVSVSRPEVGWTDLSLPKTLEAALRRVAKEAQRRAGPPDDRHDRRKARQPQSFAVLFSGPSGTGKTMAAEVVAGELGRELHRIDLSGVVSKYIGETEKNLDRVFEAADGAEVVLFFDEADALFGKRTSVKDAHDRFANAETNHLLERIQRYDGLVILAANAVGKLDHPAFISRFARVIDFPTAGRRA